MSIRTGGLLLLLFCLQIYIDISMLNINRIKHGLTKLLQKLKGAVIIAPQCIYYKV